MLKLEVSYRGLLFAGLAVLSLVALVRLWPVLVLVATALIFMAALLPYVNWLVHRGLPRTAAVLLLFFGILVVLAGLVAVVVPAMVDEFQNIHDNLPQDAKRLEDTLHDRGIDVQLESRAREVDWGELISGRDAVGYGQRALVLALSFFTVLVLTVYLLIDTPRLSRFVYQFVPPGREPEIEHLLSSLTRVVGGYVRGQAITSLCIAVYTLVVLLILGVPNAVAFAVLAGFADIIPLIGAFIATLPAVVAAFDVSPTRAAIVLVLLVLYQQFEDRFLAPRVYGSTLNLPPIIILLAILAGGELFGIVGVLLALPAAAVARVGIDYVLDSRKAAFAPPGPAGDAMAPDEHTAVEGT